MVGLWDVGLSFVYEGMMIVEEIVCEMVFEV